LIFAVLPFINEWLTFIKKQLINGGAMVDTEEPTANLNKADAPLTSHEEEALQRRYSRTPYPELTFEFTRDPGLLHQYYRLRAQEYIAVHGLKDFPATESKHDRTGHIMVARMGNFCVGGARIDVTTPRLSRLLPMEADTFRLKKHFPYLQHKQMSYCQVSGFALLSGFHGSAVTREMIGRVLEKAAALSMHMLFAACPMLNARLYRQSCASNGWKDSQIHYDIELPDDPSTEGIKLYLFSVPLAPLHSQRTLEKTQSQKHLSSETAFCGSIVTTMASLPQPLIT
jgi:hypothetical protein